LDMNMIKKIALGTALAATALDRAGTESQPA
jgi:hypothetical protein